jgi:hypothetical protein
MDRFFSGNRVLKESRDSQGQGSGHVGVPTFVKAWQCGVVESRREEALTTGLGVLVAAGGEQAVKHVEIRARDGGSQ